VSLWWIAIWVLSVIITGALCFCLGAAYEHLTRAMQVEPEVTLNPVATSTSTGSRERVA
jgi:hypothetical protein